MPFLIWNCAAMGQQSGSGQIVIDRFRSFILIELMFIYKDEMLKKTNIMIRHALLFLHGIDA
jgi:hypothetical protein